MIIATKFASVCPVCSQRIVPGTRVEWSKRAQEILDGDDFESRIAELATAAGQAGDLEMVQLCDVALGAGIGVLATDGERQDARIECARSLWDAEGR